MLATSPDIADLLKTGHRATRPGRSQLWIWGAVIAALAVLSGGAWWWFSSSVDPGARYKTVAARFGDLSMVVSTTGTIQPITQVEVGSEISGTVKAVNVTYNDHVAAGDILAVISTDQLADETDKTASLLDSAKAAVVDKQAVLLQANRDLARTGPLALHDLISTQDLETAETAQSRAQAAVDAAKAQVEVASADLASNRTQLGKASIRSPISGIVLDRNVDPGQTVAASLQSPVLFTIADDLSKMQVVVDVDEADAGTVRQGQTATFTVEAYPDHPFQAVVMQLRFAPISVSGVVSYKTVLSVDNSSLLLRPGMTAAADIVTQNVKAVLVVPNASLRYQPAPSSSKGGSLFGPPTAQTLSALTPDLAPTQKRIWVLRHGGELPVAITPGLTDGSWTQVVKGDLAVGDLVITDASQTK